MFPANSLGEAPIHLALMRSQIFKLSRQGQQSAGCSYAGVHAVSLNSSVFWFREAQSFTLCSNVGVKNLEEFAINLKKPKKPTYDVPCNLDIPSMRPRCPKEKGCSRLIEGLLLGAALEVSRWHPEYPEPIFHQWKAKCPLSSHHKMNVVWNTSRCENAVLYIWHSMRCLT